MEANQLPTNPGPYYWREKDGDEWELWHVLDDGSELTAHRGFNVAFLPDLGGQWLPIPTAEELVELQSKANAYDEGQILYGIIHSDGSIINASPDHKSNLKGLSFPVKLKNGVYIDRLLVCREVSQ